MYSSTVFLLWNVVLSFQVYSSVGFTSSPVQMQRHPKQCSNPQPQLRHQQPTIHRFDNDNGWQLCSTKKQRRIPQQQDTASTTSSTESSILDLEEPAGIVGAQFFGGNKEKEEFYDPVAEAQAGEEIEVAATTYHRFDDIMAFETSKVAQMGQILQEQINSILYVVTDDKDVEKSTTTNIQYADNLMWESCFDIKSCKNPLEGLEEALTFYKQLDVAIISGTQLEENRVQFQWQVSVVWPIFWEPRVLLSGYSEVTLKETDNDEMIITKQVDTLDSSSDLISTIGSQLIPRFWDVYHIGMTPSTEIMSRITRKQGLLPKSYNVFEIPPRLVSSPTQLDSSAGREDGNAQFVPNHAFSCVIKTMGPQKQNFVSASPVQVQIMPSGKGQGNPPKIKWSIPMSIDFQTNSELPLPGEDPEARPDSEPMCEYEFQQRRLVATVPYGGSPQDVTIADARKKLYDDIVKDGLTPKLDENGRPQFFFLQNGVKACYTEEGLGMCVYEWRPKMTKPDEVGIELELK